MDTLETWRETEVWKVIVLNTPEEGPDLDEFLMKHLKEPHKHYLGHHLRIIIESPDKDSAFKVGEWFRHQNPLKKLLNYTVSGWAGGRIIYTSGCKLCRDGGIKTLHYEHGD